MYRLIDAAAYTERSILVVGGGNAAAEAAIGLSIQRGNIVTLSYRRDSFARLTERNRKNLEERAAAGGIRLLLRSEVIAIEEGRVRLSTPEGEVVVPAEDVFVFAGGELPAAFLREAGVAMQQQMVLNES